MFVKLAEGPVTMTVASVRQQEGKFGMQIVFADQNAVTEVGLSESAATRGLAFLNLTNESVIGQTLKFEQVKKDGKTFTNIYRADGQAPSAPTQTASTAAPRASAGMTKDEAFALYAWALDTAHQTLGKYCEVQSVPLDAAALQSAAATLFIAVKGR
jgi:hypothetical protein